MGDATEHRPETRAVVAFESDQGAEQEAVADEGARAVHGIEDPAVAAGAGPGAVLFAHHAVVRIAALDQRPHRPLGAAVGGSNRRGVGLGLHAGA